MDDLGELEAESPAATFQSPYRDLGVLRFRDQRPAGRLLPIFTAALRSMVISRPRNLFLRHFTATGSRATRMLPTSVCRFAVARSRMVILLGSQLPFLVCGRATRRRILSGILGSGVDGTVVLHVPGFRQ